MVFLLNNVIIFDYIDDKKIQLFTCSWVAAD